MKIDYELVENIGAEFLNEYGQLFKFSQEQLRVWCDGGYWVKSTYSAKEAVNHLKPIPPKPQVRVEYEKITESIFDLKDEFERGDLFTKKFNQEWHQIKTEVQLGGLLSMNDDPTKNGIYRRVEKPVDWQSDVVDYIYGNYNPTNHDALSESLVTAISSGIDFKYLTQEEFLEMCQVALKAAGRI